MRQQVQVCTARFKAVFPLAVHLGRYSLYGGKSTFHEIPLCMSFVGGVPSVTARGKLHKTFHLDPVGRVTRFRLVLAVSREKIDDLQKSCASP